MKKIFILAGPSWVWKTTLWESFKKKYPDFSVEKIITSTTRTKREGEVDWKDYYFLSLEEFKQKVENKEFVEYAEVHNNFYWSTYEELERILKENKYPLYIVDPQWVKFLKEKLSWLYDVKTIFILPPSEEELKKRLIKRWESPDSEDFKIRVKESLIWLAEKDNYDYQIINDDLNNALEQLKSIFESKI